jgi:hypothetical protein
MPLVCAQTLHAALCDNQQVASLGDLALCKRLVEIQKFDVNDRDAFGRCEKRPKNGLMM